MIQRIIVNILPAVLVTLALAGCKFAQPPGRAPLSLPASFGPSPDSASIGQIDWRKYFSDDQLLALIDSALRNNQELNISLQEIDILRNEVRIRKGEYLPFVGLGAAAGIEKDGRYTRHGAVDENGEIVDIKTLERGVSVAAEKACREEIQKLTFTKTGSNVPEFSTGKITFVIRTN